MTTSTDIDIDIPNGRPGFEGMAARAVNNGFPINWMNAFLHDWFVTSTISLRINPT
jgi:hypothetical protein